VCPIIGVGTRDGDIRDDYRGGTNGSDGETGGSKNSDVAAVLRTITRNETPEKMLSNRMTT